MSESPVPVEPSSEPARLAGSVLVLQGVNVLVVDDDADTRELMCMMFEGTGAQVIAAASAEEALGFISVRKPDVLVCDVGMPDEDGYSLMRKVRDLFPGTDAQAQPIPAVALTGYSRPEDRRRALDSGFAMHVAKPFDADRLVAAVGELARSSRRTP